MTALGNIGQLGRLGRIGHAPGKGVRVLLVWILAAGVWDDAGAWDDTATWRDS
jgi:hypothetical protein